MGRKVKIVLSDLHIGAGFAQANNSLENFVADEQFVVFLQQVGQRYGPGYSDVELIINGDFLAFLQVPAVSAYDPTTVYAPHLFNDSSEAASVQRLNLIYQGHQTVFAALSGFMKEENPRRRITIIKGNHDVHFFWPLVKNRLRSLLNASGARSSLLLFAEEFICREKIYVEHGHQYGETAYQYQDFRDPRQATDPSQLAYPLGSQLVIDICSSIPAKFPLVNQIKPIPALLWYAIQHEPKLAAKSLAHLARYALRLSQNGSTPPIPTSLLFENLQNEEACYHVLQRSQDDRELRQDLYQHIQTYVNQLYPAKALAFEADKAKDDIAYKMLEEQQRQHRALKQAASKIAQQEGSQIILFGHSHQTCSEPLENGATYINTGCWVNDKSSAFSPRLPYVRIDYDESGTPVSHLLDFAADHQPQAPPPTRLPRRVSGWLNRLRAITTNNQHH